MSKNTTKGNAATAPTAPEALATAQWVAKRLGIQPWRVYQLARERLIPVVRLGRSFRFDRGAIERWVAAGGTASAKHEIATRPTARVR